MTPAEQVIELNDTTFEQTLGSSPLLLVDFWAPWCGPCRMIAPIIEEIAKDFVGKVTVAKVNVDDCARIAGTHQITSIPTIMIFRNGVLVNRFTGFTSKAVLLDALQPT